MKTIYKTAKKTIADDEIKSMLEKAIKGKALKKVLLIPPDITRASSYAGPICKTLYDLLQTATVDIIPSLGTHAAMKEEEIGRMYPGLPRERFMVHRWRDDVVKIGEIPATLVSDVSGGRMKQAIPVEVNKVVLDKSYDLIFSIGQVVPHEVAGMANFHKNIFIGLGGKDTINMSHMLGAVFGLERVMGRDHTPLHKIFDFAAQHFLADLPIIYILTVTTTENDTVNLKGLFIGNKREAFARAAALSRQHNITVLSKPLKKIVAYLPPHEFRTTWTGNKAIYRTRKALAGGGELIILGPGISGCGEDPLYDQLIRKYGYGRTTGEILQMVEDSPELKDNLAVAAHLIHSSSEGRFKITYAPGGLTAGEVESLGFGYLDYREAARIYAPQKLKYGFNNVGGEEIFFVPNPALGLWAVKQKLKNT